jgi:hypothetical protein
MLERIKPDLVKQLRFSVRFVMREHSKLGLEA